MKFIKKIFSYENNKIKQKHILLLEHEYFFTKYRFVKIKLAFHRASMMNYYDEIPKEYKKKYIQFDDNLSLEKYIKSSKIDQIRYFNLIEKELVQNIINNKTISNVENIMFPTPYFLNSTRFGINEEIDKVLTAKRHDLFYKQQRIRYNIMVKKISADKYEPLGGKWSFDRENRSPFEKDMKEPENLHFKIKTRKEYLEEAFEYVKSNFSKNYGQLELEQFIYPINHKEAKEWLDYFIKHRLDNFGKYEDALSSHIRFGYHSILSPIQNIGLITPQDILEKIENVKETKKNIASKEGFLRQVIGWREYCYYTYDLYGEELMNTPLYKNYKNKIPEKVWKGETLMPPIDNIIKNVNLNGYSHHIERLMGIGNYLILIEVAPDEIYNWFQTMYIDAYDVFMVPNVYGMLCYGKLTDKYHMMTRPYFSSSNYIIKMSDYKSSIIKIDAKEYKWDEIYDALYYKHINNNIDEFEKIYATASSVKRWKTFNADKKKRILELSKMYIDWVKK
jgi:deoxyribodipyrimidine photolyase-related protein